MERILTKLRGETKPISLGRLVGAASTEVDEYEFLFHGALQGKLSIRIYVGPELDLRIYPVIVRAGGAVENVIHYMGEKDYLDGEDDRFQWDILMVVRPGDILRVTAVNANAAYAYDYRLNCSVNYVGEG